MKWANPEGSVQRSTDGRYLVMRATASPEWWIAYALSGFATTAEKLGECADAEAAKGRCEAHAARQAGRARKAG